MFVFDGITGLGQGCLYVGTVGATGDSHLLSVQIHLHIVDTCNRIERLANFADAALAAGALNIESLCLHRDLHWP